MQLSEGEESRAFSFDVGGRGYVLRVNSCADGFYKDRYVYRHFASAALPIPEVLDIGEFMRCEIPHRCVRRKYRIRRHSPFRLRNCWEGRSVRASSLLRQLAKGGCAARRLSWVTPGFSQSRRCKTTARPEHAPARLVDVGPEFEVRGLQVQEGDVHASVRSSGGLRPMLVAVDRRSQVHAVDLDGWREVRGGSDRRGPHVAPRCCCGHNRAGW